MQITADCRFQTFADAINHLPEQLTKRTLLTAQFLIQRDNDLEMYYAPHNEIINDHAKVVIVGITPGWTQMEIAYKQARQGLQQNKPLKQILVDAKQAAGFAGTMRNNLIEMLDECGLAEALHICSSASLFNKHCDLLHTTSFIKYPVFYKGKNYTGHTPKISKSPLLRSFAYDIFPRELKKSEGALIIPLGKSVSDILMDFAEQDKVNPNHCLLGFPHPSGVNGHRKRQFAEAKENMTQQIKEIHHSLFSPGNHNVP